MRGCSSLAAEREQRRQIKSGGGSDRGRALPRRVVVLAPYSFAGLRLTATKKGTARSSAITHKTAVAGTDWSQRKPIKALPQTIQKKTRRLGPWPTHPPGARRL